MDPELKSELEAIIQTVEFPSAGSFSFAGQMAASLPALPPGAPPKAGELRPEVAQLQQHFYANCYTLKFNGAAVELTTAKTSTDPEFLEALSRANNSRDLWDHGWIIYEFLQSGQALVQKDNVFRAVWPGEFLSRDGYAQAPRSGTAVSIFLPRESRSVQQGFYFALGETAGDQQDDYKIVRFYWNLDHTHIAELVSAVTREFNRFEIPFRFKCPNLRAAYRRVDTAVVYVSRRHFRVGATLVGRVTASLADRLREPTPLFTRRLAPGLAFAEDTGTQESFGMSRCRMLAQGLWNAHQQGDTSPAARLKAVAEEFMRNGVSLDRPYLNAGSADVYEFSAIERAQ